MRPLQVTGADFTLKNVVIWKLGEKQIHFIRLKEADFMDDKRYWQLESFDKLMDEGKFSPSRIDFNIADIEMITDKRPNSIALKYKEFGIFGDLKNYKKLKRKLKKYVVLGS